MNVQSSSNVCITLCQPEVSDEWSTLIQERDDANLGQAAQWYTVIRQAYGHKPLYFQAEDTAGVSRHPPYLPHPKLDVRDSGHFDAFPRCWWSLRLFDYTCRRTCLTSP